MSYQTSLQDAKKVIATLRSYVVRAKAIESAISGKSQFAIEELQSLKLQLSKLKDNLEHNYKFCEGVK